MIQHMNALHKIASELEGIDPVMAYEFSAYLRRLVSTDRVHMLKLNKFNKITSSPDDLIELAENRSGGWDWTHTNVDGRGTRNRTGWRLQPSEVLKMIDTLIEPGPETDAVKAVFTKEVEAGNAGVPKGAEMGGGPSALSEMRPGEEKGGIGTKPSWLDDFSIWDTSLGSQKIIKKAIHVAYARPDLRPTILRILRNLVKRS